MTAASTESSAARRGLYDTSVFIAAEDGRPVDVSALPETGVTSVITLAELNAGVLSARDVSTRSRRLGTLNALGGMESLPVDDVAARHWANLRVLLAEAGRRVNVNDLWIASVALAHELPVVTQDADFDVIEEIGGLEVIRV